MKLKYKYFALAIVAIILSFLLLRLIDIPDEAKIFMVVFLSLGIILCLEVVEGRNLF